MACFLKAFSTFNKCLLLSLLDLGIDHNLRMQFKFASFPEQILLSTYNIGLSDKNSMIFTIPISDNLASMESVLRCHYSNVHSGQEW